MNNVPCKQECADDLNSYIQRDDITITTEDRGFLGNGEVITPEFSEELRQIGRGDMFRALDMLDLPAASGDEALGGGR
jgi:hypothetical protein